MVVSQRCMVWFVGFHPLVPITLAEFSSIRPMATDSLTLWPTFSLTELPTGGNSDVILTSHFGPWCSDVCRIYAGFYVSLFWKQLNSLEKTTWFFTLNNKRHQAEQMSVSYLCPIKTALNAQQNYIGRIWLEIWLHHHWWVLDGGCFFFQSKNKEKNNKCSETHQKMF